MDGLITFIAIYLLILFSILIIYYAVQGIALMRVAKVEGYKTWMAWVPIAISYLEIKVAGGNPWYLALYAVGLAVYLIGDFTGIMFFVIVGIIVSIAFAIYLLTVTYKMFKKYNVRKVFFWVGLFISPVMLVGYYKMGSTAKKMLAENI